MIKDIACRVSCNLYNYYSVLGMYIYVCGNLGRGTDRQTHTHTDRQTRIKHCLCSFKQNIISITEADPAFSHLTQHYQRPLYIHTHTGIKHCLCSFKQNIISITEADPAFSHLTQHYQRPLYIHTHTGIKHCLCSFKQNIISITEADPAFSHLTQHYQRPLYIQPKLVPVIQSSWGKLKTIRIFLHIFPKYYNHITNLIDVYTSQLCTTGLII